MANLDENPILELGRQPVPGTNPCGAEVPEDEGYIFIQAEVMKLDRIEADGPPDWHGIERAATTLLTEKTKDIEIATLLGLALFQRYKYAGLAAALGLIQEMAANFWEGLYPERPRRRKLRVEGLGDRFTEGGWFALPEAKPQPTDFDDLDRCIARAETVRSLLTEKLPDDPPDMTKFIRGLKGYAEQRPKPDAPPPAAAAAASGGSASPGAGGFTAGEVTDVSGAVNAMLGAATFIRKADAKDPIPYAVVRAIKWSKIAMPATEEAKFQIAPPEASTVDGLTHQMANGLWEHLLKGAEGAFRANDPLWLDLQRYVCAAMAGLGDAYDRARYMVLAMTAGLVRRLGSGLFELRFRDGTPLCSGETRMWIESELATDENRTQSQGTASSTNGALTEASSQARKLAGEGKVKEALRTLQDGLGSATQRRDRFLWKLSIAQLLYDAQKLRLALPLLEECRDEATRYHIDEWEPALVVDVAQTLYRCQKALAQSERNPTPEAEAAVRQSFAWLCRLDPSAALAAEPAGG